MSRKNVKIKRTRRALITSVMSLVLCLVMLSGTTYAWFTDTVTSGTNKIVAGNLDIGLKYYDGAEWKDVTNATKLFDDEAVWEPGYTEVAYLKLENLGSLALKYNLGIVVGDEVLGTNVDGETFRISDYIYMGVKELTVDAEHPFAAYDGRESALAAVTGAGLIKSYSKNGQMEADADDLYLAVVIYMPETVGNKANYKAGTTAPSVSVGVQLVATQLSKESDSFGNDYDIDAPWTGEIAASIPYDEATGTYEISNAEQLAKVAADLSADTTAYSGKTLKLVKDIDLNNINWTPINASQNSNLTFDGDGKTILNLCIKSSTLGNAGLFGVATGCRIKNVKLNHVVIDASCRVGAICGQMIDGSISGCEVNDAVISATPAWDAQHSCYVDGSKAGGIIGYQSYQNTSDITNCKVSNSVISAYRDCGGIAGYAQGVAPVISGCTVEKVTVALNPVKPYETHDGSAPSKNAGEIYGRFDAPDAVDVTGKTITDVKVIDTVAEIIEYQLSQAKPGDTITAPADNYATIDIGQAAKEAGTLKNVTIKGEDGAIAKDIDVNIKDPSRTEPVVIENLVISNIDVNNNTKANSLLTINKNPNDVIDKITYEGCDLSGSATKGDNVRGWALDSDTDLSETDLVFKDCVFDGFNRVVYLPSGPSKVKSIVFENCQFKNQASWVFHMNAQLTSEKVSFKNCSFENCPGGLVKLMGSSSVKEFEFIGNELTNCTREDNKSTLGFFSCSGNSTGSNPNGTVSFEHINVSGNKFRAASTDEFEDWEVVINDTNAGTIASNVWYGSIIIAE